MWLSFYNLDHVGDTLLLTKGSVSRDLLDSESKGRVTRIFHIETGETLGYNFFQISEVFTPDGKGEVKLTEEQVAAVNNLLEEAGFTETITIDYSPKFVIGYVKESVRHEDSDHLNITQTEVDNGEVLQIVCGASNIKKGQKVVVAKPGAVMPSGLIIWPGELRGVPSNGMICSAKELGVENPTGKKGILELDSDAEVGAAFFN